MSTQTRATTLRTCVHVCIHIHDWLTQPSQRVDPVDLAQPDRVDQVQPDRLAQADVADT